MLIVAPLIVVQQWAREIEDKVGTVVTEMHAKNILIPQWYKKYLVTNRKQKKHTKRSWILRIKEHL